MDLKNMDYSVAENRVFGHLFTDFRKRLKQAEAKGWRLDHAEARSLAELSVLLGYTDRGERLAYGLEHGAYMMRPDGVWACTTCGGNCGQCGETGFLGNIGFSLDQIVASHNGHKPVAPRKLWRGVASAVLITLSMLALLIALAGCATRDDEYWGGVATGVRQVTQP
jgi:hypothetical protein